jgi:hypothetical protein
MARLAAEGHKVILGCRRVLGFGYADSGLAEKQDGSEAVFSRMASEPIAVRLARLLVEERGPTSSLCMTPSVVMGTQTTARSIASGYAPPWLITHRVDVSAYLEQKHAAMEAHVSQMASDEGTRSLAGFVPLPSSLFRLAFGREFVEHGRVPTDHPSIMSSPVWAVIPEDDPASARFIPMVGAAGQAATANRSADIDKSTSESRLNRMSTRRALSGRAHSGELPVIGRMIPVPAAAKVPEIIFVFWVVKILTTAGGEATSDYLKTFGNIGGGGTELILLVLGLVLQFGTRRYRAFAYWSRPTPSPSSAPASPTSSISTSRSPMQERHCCGPSCWPGSSGPGIATRERFPSTASPQNDARPSTGPPCLPPSPSEPPSVTLPQPRSVSATSPQAFCSR